MIDSIERSTLSPLVTCGVRDDVHELRRENRVLVGGARTPLKTDGAPVCPKFSPESRFPDAVPCRTPAVLPTIGQRERAPR